MHVQERGGSSLTQQQLPVALQEKSRVAFFPNLASAVVLVQDGRTSRAVGLQIQLGIGLGWEEVEEHSKDLLEHLKLIAANEKQLLHNWLAAELKSIHICKSL